VSTPPLPERAASTPLPERAEGESKGDIRILTPGLTAAEIAAVTSVVTAMLQEQRGAAERDSARPEPRWRRAIEPFGDRTRGAGAWRRSAR